MGPVCVGKPKLKMLNLAPITKIRTQVRRKIANAKFPYNKRPQVENIIIRAIIHCRLYENRIRSSKLIAATVRRSNMANKRGPKDLSLIRNYLFSELHRAWLIGFGKYPAINNKTYPDTPFVVFVGSILESENIFRTIGNLEEFRSYRRRLLLDSGFKVIRGKVI